MCLCVCVYYVCEVSDLITAFSISVRLIRVDLRVCFAIDLFGSRGASSLSWVDLLKNEMEKHTRLQRA